MQKFLDFPIVTNPDVPEGHVMLAGYRQSGPGTMDPMEQYGVVLTPSGVIVEYVIRNGKVICR